MINLHIWVAVGMPHRGYGYIQNIVRNFPPEENWLYLVGKADNHEEKIPIKLICEETNKDKKYKQKTFREILEKIDCVIWHSIPSDCSAWRLDIVNQIQKLKGIKTAWVIWGHEIYDQYDSAHFLNWKHPIRFIKTLYFERVKKEFIKNLTVMIGEPEDCRLANKRYISYAKIVEYNFGGYALSSIPEFPQNENKKVRVLVGHNAYPHCRHIETFQLLRGLVNENIEVVCPLPYKDKMPELVNQVTAVGKEIFRENFIPIYQILEYNEYCQLLFGIDVAIFNHTRQMAEGNVEKLLYYGKKIYFSEENTNYNTFSSLGAQVFKIKDMTENFIEPLTLEVKNNNKHVIENELSDDTFKKVWREVFES